MAHERRAGVEAAAVGRPALPVQRGVVDLGAGAFHLAVGNPCGRGHLRSARVERRPVQMIEPLQTGRLDEASWGVGRGALLGLGAVVAARRETAWTAVASSWFGELDNGAAFLADARSCLGLPIELLTGREQASLVWSSAVAQVPSLRGTVATLAVGASSLQLALGIGRMCVFAASLPLGALRLRARLLPPGRPLDGAAARAISDAVLCGADGAAKELRAFRPTTLLLAGGSCRALGRAAQAISGRCTPERLSRRDALGLVALLSGGGAAHAAAHHLGHERAESLAPAAIVLSSVLALLGIDEGLVVPAGFREGLVLRALAAEGGALAHDDCH